MKDRKTKLYRNRGITSVVMLLVLTVLLLGALAVSGIAGSGMSRARREYYAAQTFQAAQAGVDYQRQELINYLEQHGLKLSYQERKLEDLPITLPEGVTGKITVMPFEGDRAWITCEAQLKGVSRSVRVLVKARDVSIWNNAIFAGSGASGQAINGNVDIRGSVHLLGNGEAFSDLNGNGKRDDAEPFEDKNGNGMWDAGENFTDSNGDGVWNPAEPYNDSNWNGKYDPPMTVTELNSSFSGTAYIGNNYNGAPADLISKIPPIPEVDGKKSLSTEVRVKHGQIKIQGSATVGTQYNYNGAKGPVDGTYVSDGWTGSPGAGGVYSDNGTGEQYDLGDKVEFPLIDGIGAEPYYDAVTGTTYSTFKDYLDDNSMTVNLSSFSTSMSAFTYGPDAQGNYLSWDPSTNTLTIKGIIKINGNFTLGQKKQTINFDGNGTFYSTGTIDIHANLLPKSGKLFPTGAVIGLVALKDINLATGSGDSQLMMMGAFYAQGTIRSAKQNQIAGTFVANYYDMGTNVPNIYQVPKLKDHLPPGMPGGEIYVTVKQLTWRDRVPKDG
ncbi:MAG TPA: hypothetical protein VNK96_00950 [Fimbriimonadales bacterium]|nr:hypothetical protein [Fimbriimonadales bacterium]